MKFQKLGFDNNKAQTLVEFSLILPVFLLLTIAALEFGRVMAYYAAVNSAARQGARYGVAIGAIELDSSVMHYFDCDGIEDAVYNNTFLSDRTAGVTINFDDGVGNPTVPSDCAEVAALSGANIEFGDRIVVQVEKDVTLILNRFGLDIPTFNITAVAKRSITKGISIEVP